MDAIDCTDIKALLSGLIDGEVDEPMRHAAERHLAGCSSCRDLVNEAEGLDELVAAEVASFIDPRGLPPGFEGAVLGRTLYEDARSGYLRQWTTWTGWFAAAAALALAVIIWVDRRPDPRSTAQATLPPAAGDPMLPGGLYVTNVRSFTLDDVLETEWSSPSTLATPLSREDSDALYFTSILLDMVMSPDGDLEQVREAVEYDRLVPKLRAIRDSLGPADRVSLLAAEALLVEILEGPVEGADLATVRSTISDLALSRSLQSLSDRWDLGNAL